LQDIVREGEQPTGLSWSGSSVELTVINDCEGITLMSGKCHVFKGRNHSEFCDTIPFGGKMSMKLKATMPIFGRTSCCLIYEITRHKKERLPIMWGYRIFIAIEVLITPTNVDERKAVAVVFLVKNREFTGDMSEIKKLNEDLLHYFMNTESQVYHWYVGGRRMELDAKFSRNTHAQLTITLRQSKEFITLDPMFYRFDRFA
jgi:hypothetical protein